VRDKITLSGSPCARPISEIKIGVPVLGVSLAAFTRTGMGSTYFLNVIGKEGIFSRFNSCEGRVPAVK
jgi:hypothetical protein